jgi:hypothetical protein
MSILAFCSEIYGGLGFVYGHGLNLGPKMPLGRNKISPLHALKPTRSLWAAAKSHPVPKTTRHRKTGRTMTRTDARHCSEFSYSSIQHGRRWLAFCLRPCQHGRRWLGVRQLGGLARERLLVCRECV